MPDINPNTPPMQNRPLTGAQPATAPATAPAPAPANAGPTNAGTVPSALFPGLPSQAAPQQPAAAPPAQPTMAPDQTTLANGAARDPQIVAAISIFAMQLQSANPVEVSSAIAQMERFGPAYKQDVLNAVAGQLFPGQDRMRTLVLIDALVRNGGQAHLQRLLPLINDQDSEVRIAASKAYGELKGAGATPAGTNPAAPAAPAAPAPAAAMATPQTLAPELVGVYERIKAGTSQRDGTALWEFANMKTADQVAIANAMINDPQMFDDKLIEAAVKVLSAKVQEPGVLDCFRNLVSNARPDMTSEALYHAKVRAGVALLHFGGPQDHRGILKLVLAQSYAASDIKGFLIDQIAKRPDMLAMPAVTQAMIAVMNKPGGFAKEMLAATHALSETKSNQARDAIGEGSMLKDLTWSDNERCWALDWLAKFPGPFSAMTIENLKQIVLKKPKTNSAAKAEALLKKAGVKI